MRPRWTISGAAVAEGELHPHLGAQRHHAFDDALHGAGVGIAQQVEVVRAMHLAVELGDRADEAHHEVVGRLVVDLERGADLLDPALVEHHDLVGHLHRLLLVVGDEHGGHVEVVVQAAQPGAQLLAHPRVERAERLVEQQHARLARPARGRAPSAGAGRPRACPGSGRPSRSRCTSSSSSSTRALDLVLRALADLQAEGHVVAHGHVLERGVVLEHEADVAPLRAARR